MRRLVQNDRREKTKRKIKVRKKQHVRENEETKFINQTSPRDESDSAKAKSPARHRIRTQPIKEANTRI